MDRVVNSAHDDEFAAALTDVVVALQSSTASHLEVMEQRLIARAQAAALVVVAWGVALFAALVAWASANLALAAWVSVRYGDAPAALVATAIHSAAAFVAFRIAQVRGRAPALALAAAVA